MHSIASRFAKLTSFLQRRRFGVTLLVAIFVCFTAAYFGHAQDEASATDVAVALSNPTTFINLALTTVLTVIAWVLGKLIVLIIGMVIIPILGYNNFANSNVVDIGWPLVRDIVNMFVVVVLLVIAIKTILGLGKANWEQQLPRLFLAIIAVNFSRTICLIMIDLGQVVMFTFVNAIRDIAAGNFVNLFQINSFMSFDLAQIATDITQANGNGGLNSFGYLGTAYATVVFLSMVLAVMLLLAAIFIYRVVILWVLIIMSPLAFFLGGIGDTLGSTGGQYATWWKKMVGAITLGPILTFFLWLALAAASNGPVATSEQFSLVQSPDASEGGFNSGIYTEIFQVDKLLSLFIAIILITVGFQAASSQAGALGGIAAQFVTEEGGKKLARGLAAAPAALGYRAGRAVAVEGARQIERRTGIGKELGGDLIKGAAALREIPIVGSTLGNVAARRLSAVGGRLQKASSESEKEARKNADERIAAMSDDQKTEMLQAIGSGKLKSTGPGGFMQSKDEVNAMVGDYMKNKSTRDDYKDSLKSKHAAAGKTGTDLDDAVDADMQAMNKQVIKFYSDPVNEQKFVGDDDAKKASLLKFRTANLQHMQKEEKDAAGNTVLDAAGKPKMVADAKARQKVIDDDKFNPANLSAGAVEDDDIRERLKNKTTRTYTDKDGNRKTESAWDNVSRGIGVGDDIRKVLPEVLGKEIPKMTASQLEQAFKSGTVKVESLKPDQFNDADQAKKIARAMVNANQTMDPNKIPFKGATPADADAARAKFRTAAAAELDKDRMAATTVDAKAKVDGKIAQVVNDGSAAGASQAALKAHGYDDSSGKFIADETNPNFRRDGDKTVAINVRNDVTYVNKLPASATAGYTDMTRAVATGISPDDLRKALDQARVGDPSMKAEVKAAMTKLEKMLNDSLSDATLSAAELTKAQESRDAARTAMLVL